MKNRVFQDIQNLITENKFTDAVRMIKDETSSSSDISIHNKYISLFSQIPQSHIKAVPLKITILTTSTMDIFKNILSFWFFLEGFKVDFLILQNSEMKLCLANNIEKITDFKSDFIWLFTSSRDLKFSATSYRKSNQDVLNSNYLSDIKELWSKIKKSFCCSIIQNNFELPIVRQLGNAEVNDSCGITTFVLLLNQKLSVESKKNSVYIFDQAYIASFCGLKNWYDTRFWYYSRHSFNLNFSGIVSYNFVKLISAIKGNSKKGIILDLDDTIWGGIVGELGVNGINLDSQSPEGAAFLDFQKYVLNLKQRGIIIAVCSKNDINIAKTPFQKHSNMLLTLDDISCFMSNWRPKIENIKIISEKLNISIDSLVFIDNDPVERFLAKESMPELTVPNLPQDPTEFVLFLEGMNLFETSRLSAEDTNRTKYYNENKKRLASKDQINNIKNFLRDLSMTANCIPITKEISQRVHQLINKTNQFNLTLSRSSEEDLNKLLNDSNFICYAFNLNDKFGSNGIVSSVLLKKTANKTLSIHSWVMSCRVFSRTLEYFIFNFILKLAKEQNFSRLEGTFVKTDKSNYSEQLFQSIGFRKVKELKNISKWDFKVSNKKNVYLQTFIKTDPAK